MPEGTTLVMMMVWKCLNDQAPSYLVELIHSDCKKRPLRSSSSNLLVIPKTNRKTFGDRSFTVSDPVLWNKLPTDLRVCKALEQFKSKLKTWEFET